MIRFPQTDLREGKLRPALVIAQMPGRHEDLLLALITSRIYQAVPAFDEIVAPSDADFGDSGLKVRSAIRLTRLTTVNNSIINARLGTIAPTRLEQLKARLIRWLQSDASIHEPD